MHFVSVQENTQESENSLLEIERVHESVTTAGAGPALSEPARPVTRAGVAQSTALAPVTRLPACQQEVTGPCPRHPKPEALVGRQETEAGSIRALGPSRSPVAAASAGSLAVAGHRSGRPRQSPRAKRVCGGSPAAGPPPAQRGDLWPREPQHPLGACGCALWAQRLGHWCARLESK